MLKTKKIQKYIIYIYKKDFLDSIKGIGLRHFYYHISHAYNGEAKTLLKNLLCYIKTKTKTI